MSLKLNIGGGLGKQPEGFISVDRKSGGEAYPVTLSNAVCDADGNKMPVASNSVDEIRCSHCLEHFSHRHTTSVMAEFVRCLKPGGTLKIAVPDLDRCIAARAEGIPIPFEQFLMGGHVDENDQHGALFDEHTTTALMRHVGLRNIRRWTSEEKDCASFPISLNLMGTKRGPVDLSGTVAVMTVPRLGFTDTYRAIIETVEKLGIKFTQAHGVFWDKGLTRAVNSALEMDAKRILVIDYDSLFHAHNVEELIWLLETSGYDAICPSQVQRGKNRMIACVVGSDGVVLASPTVGDLEHEVVLVRSGHFGLTAIKASVFEKIPHPWFHHEPDKDGKLSEECTDADIAFWRKFPKAGLKVGLATHVAIGHCEMVATFPDQGFNPIYQYIDEWRKKGPPVNVRR